MKGFVLFACVCFAGCERRPAIDTTPTLQPTVETGPAPRDVRAESATSSEPPVDTPVSGGTTAAAAVNAPPAKEPVEGLTAALESVRNGKSVKFIYYDQDQVERSLELGRRPVAFLERSIRQGDTGFDRRFLEKALPLGWFFVGDIQIEVHVGLLVLRQEGKPVATLQSEEIKQLTSHLLDELTDSQLQKAFSAIGVTLPVGR
ncbi:hypothetical protein [Planctomyces sp. SH-PL14]|uniref:hypothetical protein n=1 Tax=Planctomyces sp. SH-PL14 TaxID=1632864 RepID=UPI0018D30DC6|nr:hypothetical protein [Planctomyces sp. SH-PL14]